MEGGASELTSSFSFSSLKLVNQDLFALCTKGEEHQVQAHCTEAATHDWGDDAADASGDPLDSILRRWNRGELTNVFNVVESLLFQGEPGLGG